MEDVDADPVVLFDGLTKNWRYPGWRCSWIVGPRQVIEAVSSSGSFLDGGGSKPLQRSAVPLLGPDRGGGGDPGDPGSVPPEARASWPTGLREAGVRFDLEPEGTFYCWGDISGLPPAINDGMSFFRAALERKVICVPGEFFDVNPGKRRSGRPSRFRHYVRFSFGPEEATVVGRGAADRGDGDGETVTVGDVTRYRRRSPSAALAPCGLSSVSRGTISNRSPTIP